MSGFGGGFSFSKASGGGGGKIRRSLRRTNFGGQFKYLDVGVLSNPPTSPQQWINGKVAIAPFLGVATSPGNSYIYPGFNSSGNAQTITHTFSVSSNIWVDFLWVRAQMKYDVLSDINLSVNGNSISVMKIPGTRGFTPYPLFYYDVYGYGMSVTWQVINTTSQSYDTYMGLGAPNTVITQSGSVVHPPALSGRSVARDI